MDVFVNHNGAIVPENQVFISPNSRGFKYGDGCFETMKLIHGKVQLEELHYDRLFSSLHVLQFTVPVEFSRQYLHEQIKQLANKNKYNFISRIRLTIYRGDGYIAGDSTNEVNRNVPNFIIQNWPCDDDLNHFNKRGLNIDFYPDARKSCDKFSSLKSNNYLQYSMAARWAKTQNIDDCLLYNCYDRVADASIANVFIVSDRIIKTPALNEGCVSGTVRQYLLSCFEKQDILFAETKLTSEDILNASEVFLTNAIYGIRWVERIGENQYDCVTSSMLYEKLIMPLLL